MTVALELTAFLPATAPDRPHLRVVPAPVAAPPYDDEVGAAPLPLLLPTATLPARQRWDDSVWFTEDRTPAVDLPPVETVAHGLVQGLVEVFAGARPLRLFRLQLDVDLFAHLTARLGNGRRQPGPRPQRVVRSLHAQVRPEGVAEVCATVRRDEGWAAVALRLEGFGGRWVCTDLEGL